MKDEPTIVSFPPDVDPLADLGHETGPGETILSPLEHFLNLAIRGERLGVRSLGARSLGEGAAQSLAMQVLDSVPNLDNQAVAGLIAFIRVTKFWPSAARDLLSEKGSES